MRKQLAAQTARPANERAAETTGAHGQTDTTLAADRLRPFFTADDSQAFVSAVEGCGGAPGGGPARVVVGGAGPGLLRVAACSSQARTAVAAGAWTGNGDHSAIAAPAERLLALVGPDPDPRRAIACVYDDRNKKLINADRPKRRLSCEEYSLSGRYASDDHTWTGARRIVFFSDSPAGGEHENDRNPAALTPSAFDAAVTALQDHPIWVSRSLAVRLRSVAHGWEYPIAVLAPERQSGRPTQSLRLHLALPAAAANGDNPRRAKLAENAASFQAVFTPGPDPSPEIVVSVNDLADAIGFVSTAPDDTRRACDNVAIGVASSGHVAVASGVDDIHDRLCVICPASLSAGQP